jgi:hypothetical protein
MHSPPFVVRSLVDYTAQAHTLIDSGNLTYGVVSEEFARRNRFTKLQIAPKFVQGVTGGLYITQIVRVRLDLDSHSENSAFFYVVPDQLGYDLILGLPWLSRHDARLEPNRGKLYLRSSGARIFRTDKRTPPSLNLAMISASAMGGYIRRARRTKDDSIQVGAISMADVQKALSPKKHVDPRTKLPEPYLDMIDLFEPKNAEELPPFRGEGVDHQIDLVQQDGKDPEVPWGPLYNMTQEELIVLRKTLTELLDKNFIRVSHSSAGAPVLFVRKPGGGLRFCVDYRALNAITKKDRYPIPLIQETLNQIGRAKWFTKLDVSAAFHKIRIAKGQEWMTAFRTRYGLYEWLVTPFGLANAPSTFQKYINWALREHLDEFCSAYLDDVLVYTNGSLDEHHAHVRTILKKLAEAGLYLDIKKCEFDCTETKYLGYIIRAGEGTRMDPEKIRAILDWQPPTTVRGVRGFLGFANFYRKFIRGFSQIVRPLNELTQKDNPFIWTPHCQTSFEILKKAFAEEPVLQTFDPSRPTVVETDSSGYSVGGVLSQHDTDNDLRPCGYFSKRNSPAECNYEIYDKELLAIVRCLEAWDAELRSLQEFTVLTDHKNLEYFFQPRKLTERHVRWNLFLSRYNMKLQYRKGDANQRADALSRRDQDMPTGSEDERVKSRTRQLLTSPTEDGIVRVAIFSTPHDDTDLWSLAQSQDPTLQEATSCVQQGMRKFPSRLGLKVSISECDLSPSGHLRFRGRRWVPDWEPLRTELIRTAHEDPTLGHPGREETYTVLSREYFWPRMSQQVRRYTRNCNVCGRTKPWRDQRKGLLKPLPVPDRPWQDITMDFIVGLPKSNGHTNILVITDKLTKGVILEGMSDIDTHSTAWVIVRRVIGAHGIPRSITSDRGKQFENYMWARVCQLIGTERRLSTAWHPQTDGATERANSTLEAYLRAYVCYDQSDWSQLLPMAELAINSRTTPSTGFSPFFLAHGYNPSPFQTREDVDRNSTDAPKSPIQQGETIVRTIRGALDWAQASLTYTQQSMEQQANKSRAPAPEYRVGDQVWLTLKNITTDRPNKKLDWKNAKYTVQRVLGSHTVRLNTPPGIHPVFHVDLLRPAAIDALPSQQLDDTQPAPQPVNQHEEYEVEKIINERFVRKGRGKRLWYLVKWTGYARPTWEPAAALQDTEAAARWVARTEA